MGGLAEASHQTAAGRANEGDESCILEELVAVVAQLDEETDRDDPDTASDR